MTGGGRPTSSFVVISGCSSGGKSTLIEELARRGEGVVEEPGRRIVREELACGGSALPWLDPAAFLRRAIAMAEADLERAAARPGQVGWTFFDRGLIDAALALEHVAGEPASARLARFGPFHRTVFLAPPWSEIYAQDLGRRHTLADALPEWNRLQRAYPALGYDMVLLPKVGVAERADFVLKSLASRGEEEPSSCDSRYSAEDGSGAH